MPLLTERWRLAVLLLPTTLAGQGRGWEFHLGRWYNGNRADVYEFRTASRGGDGVFTHGFGVSVLVNDSLGRHRAFYGLGYEVQALRGRSTLSVYPLAGLELGLSTDPASQELAALWSVGAGVDWRPLGWFALGSELRYRLEDRGPRGFWNPRSDAHTGVSAAIGVSLGLGKRAGGEAGRRVATQPHPSCRRRGHRPRSAATPATWCRPRSSRWARRTCGAAPKTTASIARA